MNYRNLFGDETQTDLVISNLKNTQKSWSPILSNIALLFHDEITIDFFLFNCMCLFLDSSPIVQWLFGCMKVFP